ncbi:O-antigen ligase like membrane protein [Collinsella intestinalis]|uniref:O-antigen ligase like membrane protein n=1 Tax=Collinsella intestinalis TaxID=147207 RepID=A0A5K1IUG5_9ACTN|nr:O-antigen ligase family protein [Collinsella intestinalis]VWL92295.1 O-antigen ligase like membrane protein [Collinsella intestinalis]
MRAHIDDAAVRRGTTLNDLWQYVLIYLSLLAPGSTFVYMYGGSWFYMMLLGLFMLTCLLSKKYRESYGICLSALLLANTVIARALSGGVGLNALMGFVGCVLVVQMAICCDYANFIRRWLITVVALAAISIGFWLIACVAPSMLDTLLGPSFVVDVIGTYPWHTYEYGRGVILYSWFNIHQFRNCGIFTEPGKYQVVLNSALFILLFWKGRIGFKSESRYNFSLLVIILAIMTCQSTTGYIGALSCVLFFVLFERESAGSGIKGKVLILVMLAAIVLLIQHWTDPSESILTTQILNKLFGGGSGLDLSEGTGSYRSDMIDVCLRVIADNPFGVGYDALFSAAASSGEGLVAAAFVAYAAVYGIIPWVLILFGVFYPVFKGQRLSSALLFAVLFVNTTLAQTHFLYTGLLIIPAYLAIGHGWPLRLEGRKYSQWKDLW